MAVDLKRIVKGKVERPPRVVLYGFEGVGKAQPIDAMVMTPTGFVEMGSLEVGDRVVGSDGKPVHVVGVFPQGKKKVFRVVMKDGAETECCEDHLWETTTVTDSLQGKPSKVRALAEIREKFLYRKGTEGDPSNANDVPNHRIPVAMPVEFDSVGSLPLQPYLLGLLLGDGVLGADSVEFCKPEPDVMDRLATMLPESDTITRFEDGTGLRIRRKKLSAPRDHSDTSKALSMLGLRGLSSLEKFIPDAYLFASVEDRTELLRGICDTDGHVIRSGQRVEISTSSPRLRDGVLFLVRSLGGVITLTQRVPTYTHNGERRTGSMSWRMLAAFPHGLCPVSSEKHLVKWRTDQTPHYQTIVEVEEVGEKDCRCIKVDAENGLYLTDDFIVTHNTGFAAGAPNVFFLDANQGSHKYNVERVAIESWVETFEWLDAIEQGHVKCDNVALDVLSDLENMSHAHLFPDTSISKYEGGYGKGDDVALMAWRQLLAKIERVWLRGKGVIFIAHAQVKKFEDPTGPGYERFELACRKNIAALLKGWSDYVFFARESVTLATEKGKTAKATTTGERWIYTKRTPAYDAKARGTVLFPDRIPLSWEEFSRAVKEDDERGKQMTRELEAMLAEIGDKAYEKQVRDFLAQYPPDRHPNTLVDSFNRVQIRLNEKKSESADAEKKPVAPAAA